MKRFTIQKQHDTLLPVLCLLIFVFGPGILKFQSKTQEQVRSNIKLNKLKGCSKKECCKQCRYVKFNGTMTKWPVQKLIHTTTQKHVQDHDATKRSTKCST